MYGTYMDILFVFGVGLGGLGNQLLRYTEHRLGKILLSNPVQLSFVWLSLFYDFHQAPAHVGEFKMGACHWARVLLVGVIFFSVDTLVVRKVYVVAVRVRLQRRLIRFCLSFACVLSVDSSAGGLGEVLLV